jgi:hypothetical protein
MADSQDYENMLNAPRFYTDGHKRYCQAIGMGYDDVPYDCEMDLSTYLGLDDEPLERTDEEWAEWAEWANGFEERMERDIKEWQDAEFEKEMELHCGYIEVPDEYDG